MQPPRSRLSQTGLAAMAIVSRSAAEFMRRHGMVSEPESPAPRLDLRNLLVHTAPAPASIPEHTLEGYEGDPPPDRGTARPWPYS